MSEDALSDSVPDRCLTPRGKRDVEVPGWKMKIRGRILANWPTSIKNERGASVLILKSASF